MAKKKREKEKVIKRHAFVGHYLQYLTYRAFEFFLALLKLETTFAIGEFLGRFLFRLPLHHRAIVFKNLRLAFRNEKSPEQIRILAEQVYERTGANLLTSIRIPTFSDDDIRNIVHIENHELVQEPVAAGKGIVLLIPHMGNWELFAQIKPLFLENTNPPIEVGTHYRPLNNPYLNALVERRRKRRGTRLFSKGTSLHTLTAHLREGNLIAVLADQRVGRQGKICDFFGLPTDCSPLPSLLARRAGSALLAIHCETVAPARWKLVLSSVPGTDTAACMQSLEAAWRASPADVFWFQDRWKYPLKKGLIPPPAE